jgi:hypothetical protein
MKINVFKESVYEEWRDVISKNDMYMLYIWSISGRVYSMCKIGERWVHKGDSVLESIYDRIVNGSLGQSTDKVAFNNGELLVHAIIDVSEFAKSIGKFKLKSQIDNFLCRDLHTGIQEIRITQNEEHNGTEHHNIDPEYAEKLILDFIQTNNCGSKELECGTKVGETAIKIMTLLHDGYNHIAGELATRFRKTLLGGILMIEMDWDMLIVTSYVKTVASSYFGQLKKYKVFGGDRFLFIDLGEDDDYKKKINNAIKEGKKVIAYISATKGSKRDERYKFIYKSKYCTKCNRATIIEEPDFGIWKKGQSEPIVKYHNKNEIVLILGGTNIDRATIQWPQTKLISVPYIDLEIQKKLTKEKLGI